MSARRPPLRIALACASASLLAASPCAALDPPAPVSNEARAEQLFRSGEKNFDAGRHTEACHDFDASLKLAPKLGTLLNLALCHEKTGKVVTAWAEFHHASAWAVQNGQKDRREFALTHLASLEPRLPRVALQLPVTSVAISNIDLDGEPLPEQKWYLPLFLDPGEHVVAISAPGKDRATASFRVVDSPTEQLVVVPPLEDAKASSPPKEPAPAAADPSRPIGLVLVAVGGAGILTGAGFGIAAITGDDADAKGAATVSTIAFGAGALLLAAGGYVLLTSRPTGPRVSVAPHVSGGAALVTTSF
jgi:hypothetical protein